MSNLRIERVTALPASGSRKTSTIYLVASDDPMLVDLYIVGNSTSAVRHIATKTEMLSAVTNMIDTASDALTTMTTEQLDILADMIGPDNLDPVLIFNNALI